MHIEHCDKWTALQSGQWTQANHMILKNHSLFQPQIHFLENYRNPCWFEQASLDEAYKHNFYSTLESSPYLERYIKSFNYMKDLMYIRALVDNTRSKRISWRIRCVPYFYLAGAPRSGSTELFSALAYHQNVLSGENKEPSYWNRIRHSHPSK